jgi:hypothetical protein
MHASKYKLETYFIVRNNRLYFELLYFYIISLIRYETVLLSSHSVMQQVLDEYAKRQICVFHDQYQNTFIWGVTESVSETYPS